MGAKAVFWDWKTPFLTVGEWKMWYNYVFSNIWQYDNYNDTMFFFVKKWLLIKKKVVLLQPLSRDVRWIVDAPSHADKKAET